MSTDSRGVPALAASVSTGRRAMAASAASSTLAMIRQPRPMAAGPSSSAPGPSASATRLAATGPSASLRPLDHDERAGRREAGVAAARQLVAPEVGRLPADQGLDGVMAAGPRLEHHAAAGAALPAPAGCPPPGAQGVLGVADLGVAEGGVGADHDDGAAAGHRRAVLDAGDGADDDRRAGDRPRWLLARLHDLAVEAPHRRALWQDAGQLGGDLAGGAQPGAGLTGRAAPRDQHVGALAPGEGVADHA